MKKVLAITIAMLMVLGVFNGCSAENKMIETTSVNDEMKIPYTCDLDPEYGADSVERDGDHTDSPYFKAPDFYNMKPTESLTILSNFKTQQQTSEWSCGVSSALMIDGYSCCPSQISDHGLTLLSHTVDNKSK